MMLHSLTVAAAEDLKALLMYSLIEPQSDPLRGR